MRVVDHRDEHGSNDDPYVGHGHEQLDFRILLSKLLKTELGVRELQVDLCQDFRDRFDQVPKSLLQLCLVQVRDKVSSVAAW